MLINKIIFFVIILVIISLLYTQKEYFSNSNSNSNTDSSTNNSNKKSDKEVFYKDIIRYKKYYDIDDKNINLNNKKIPRIIIQTWKSDFIPEKYVKEIQSLYNFNPNFTFIFFNDDDIETFLSTKYPNYLKVYNELPVKIQKIDFFRYIAVYHYGGFYFDLDITGKMSLDNLLNFKCIFPIDQHLNCEKSYKRIQSFCDKNMHILLGQYALASVPRDPFIAKLVNTICDNIDYYNEVYKTNKSQWYVYGTTGPDYVTHVYLNYPDKQNIHILYHKENQKFGEYAEHNCFGTWKN